MVRHLRLNSVRRLVLILAVAALVAPLLVSVVDVALVKLMGWGQHSWWELWQRRFWSNLAATLVFLPPLLFWNDRLPRRLRREVQTLRWRKLMAQTQGGGRWRGPDGLLWLPPAPTASASSRSAETVNPANQRDNLEHLSRVAVLGKLAAALAHELNQPLAAILSNAQAARRFLSHQPVDLDEIREILDDIVNEDRRAGEVIHRLRELFVKGELQLHILSLNELVQDVIELTRADLIERKIDFVLQLSPERPEVRGDRVQLQQVLLNFVMNASEAIRSGDMARGRLEISTERHGELVNVNVSDNGPGVPPALIERVFDAFFTTKKNGMGFGLSISSTIVNQHGGRIEVRNNREGGARFSMVLPRHQEIRKDR